MGTNQHVTNKSDEWRVIGENNKKSTKTFPTQKEAIEYGRKIAINQKSELVIHGKDGKKVVLLNPSERAKRFSRELANGRKQNGERLTAAEAGFRMGVLNERKTQAKIYCRENGIKSKARKHKK